MIAALYGIFGQYGGGTGGGTGGGSRGYGHHYSATYWAIVAVIAVVVVSVLAWGFQRWRKRSVGRSATETDSRDKAA